MPLAPMKRLLAWSRVVSTDLHCLFAIIRTTFIVVVTHLFRIAHVVENFKTFSVAIRNPFIPGSLENFFEFKVSTSGV